MFLLAIEQKHCLSSLGRGIKEEGGRDGTVVYVVFDFDWPARVCRVRCFCNVFFLLILHNLCRTHASKVVVVVVYVFFSFGQEFLAMLSVVTTTRECVCSLCVHCARSERRLTVHMCSAVFTKPIS